MQAKFHVVELRPGGDILEVDESRKDAHKRHNTGLVVRSQRVGRLHQYDMIDFYTPVLALKTGGVDSEGRQKISPDDVAHLVDNLYARPVAGEYLYPVLHNHTGAIRFHRSNCEDAEVVQTYIPLNPNETMLREKWELLPNDEIRTFNNIRQTCYNVLDFRDNQSPRVRDRRLAAAFRAANTPRVKDFISSTPSGAQSFIPDIVI